MDTVTDTVFLHPRNGSPDPWWKRLVHAHPALLISLGLVVVLPLFLSLGLLHHLFFDRSELPNLNAFIRFEQPAIGEVKDTQGHVLIELATEYRRILAFEDVPPILRQAIVAAEDRHFFSHNGVEYGALPRIAVKTVVHTLRAWMKGAPGPRLRLPQGGSTLTQQLVRSYFLQELTRYENGNTLVAEGILPRVVAVFVGVPATNKLARKVEEIRLTFWLEEALRRHYGSRALAKREIFARYASFIYMGHNRYGFGAASEYYFRRALSSYTREDAAQAALLAGIPKSPRDYAPDQSSPRIQRRRNQILALMARNGYISPELAKRAQSEPVTVAPPRAIETEAPAVIETVFDELQALGEGQFKVADLIDGRIAVKTTADARMQTIVNEALENGLARYEKRHPKAKGEIQGSVVVLRNADAAILAMSGGRRMYQSRSSRYSDLNRATGSLRQPGSAWKPLVYLTAFAHGLNLESTVPDEPVAVRMGDGAVKWIANYDHEFKGDMPLRQALAESRNGVAVWLAQGVGLENISRTARSLGIKSSIQPYITTALGASEVRLLELAGVYRALASGLLAEPHVVDRVTESGGRVVYEAPRSVRDIWSAGVTYTELLQVQEGLRGVIRLPGGTAHALDSRDFPIPVMGKTGTTSDFRDALFVGSTWGPAGITVAVRIGFDDNRTLGSRETGGRTAMPVFKEIMLRAYKDQIVGPVPRFPHAVEEGIDAYLALQRERELLGAPPTTHTVAAAYGNPSP